LRLSVKTKLEPLEVLDRASKYFEENGLTLVETIAHLHGQGGFTEIRVSGGKLVGKAEYDSKDVLDELVKITEEKFSFKPVSFALHFHAPIGYADVSVTTERPTEITFETMEYDHQVKEFAGRLPKA